MSIWDWIRDYLAQAARNNDTEKLRLGEFHPRAWDSRETDPDRTLALYEEGRRHAQALGEPWWEAFFEFWCIQSLIWFKVDYRTVLDRAVQSVLNMRKPLFHLFPLRFATGRNLIAAYLNIDPLGYAEQILEAITHLEAELAHMGDGEDKYLVQGDRMAFHFELGQWQEAEDGAMQLLRWASIDGDDNEAVHHSIYTYSSLCEIAYRKQDWDALANWARTGESLAWKNQRQMQMAEFALWQAFLARREEDEARGRQLSRRATARLTRLGTPPSRAAIDALCGFHALAGEYATALEVRRRELSAIVERGRFADEARCRIHICHLLHRLGEELDADLSATHAAIARLKKPERYQAELQQGFEERT
jgi:hypothetical protein